MCTCVQWGFWDVGVFVSLQELEQPPKKKRLVKAKVEKVEEVKDDTSLAEKLLTAAANHVSWPISLIGMIHIPFFE